MRPCVVFLVAVLTTACSRTPPSDPSSPRLRRFDHDFPALGTRFHVTFFAPDAAAATGATDAVGKVVGVLETTLSADRVDSEIARLCAGAGGPPRKLSDDLFAVLELAQRVARRSGGAFDVTAGPYLSLWRRAGEAGAEPADDQLEVVRPLVGWEKLRLDPIERTASLDTPGMRLDPGGLGHGYAADRVLDTLRTRGVDRAFVETEDGPSGRVRVFGGPPPGEAGWGLELPRHGGRRPAGPVPTVSHAAIASSAAGRVLDPQTGRAEPGKSVAVVLAPSGATAAALAAAAAVLGPGRGEQVVRESGAAIRFEPLRATEKPRRGGRT